MHRLERQMIAVVSGLWFVDLVVAQDLQQQADEQNSTDVFLLCWKDMTGKAKPQVRELTVET